MSQVATEIQSIVSEEAGIRLQWATDGIAEMVFDLPGEKINKLSKAVFERLDQVIDSLRKEKTLRAVVVRSGKADIFIAGADITEIAGVTARDDAERMSGAAQLILHKLQDLRVPVVAAIHGACLGGGLELALACDWRIASDSDKTKLGQPEVNLGIIPGAGGTQRLPRLVGLQSALDLILSGRTLDARKAKRMGLVDELALPSELHQKALDRAIVLAKKKFKHRNRSALGDFAKIFSKPQSATKFLLEDTPLGRKLVFTKARAQVMKKTGGHYPAALKAISAVAAAVSGSEKRGYAREAALFGELAVSPVCKNLIRVFFASESLKKDPGAVGVKPKSVSQMAVLGAGIMGGGIAQLFAQKGIRVRLKDINHEAIGKGLRAAHEVFADRVKRRRMKERELHAKMTLISPTLEYSGFAHLDLVVEAVLEDLSLKQKVLAEVEAKVPKDAIIATNTSSISITKIAAKAQHPQRVVGMHFFNPVSRMPLVEVIPGTQTSPEAIASIVALAKTLGKVPVVVGDGPGFLVNRLLGIYLNEASRIFDEGVPIEVIDRAMVRFGMPMGPFRLLDEVGFQTAAKVGKILEEGLGKRLAPPDTLSTAIHDQRGGRMNGRGFYDYEEDSQGREVDLSVYDLWPSRKTREMDDALIVERLVFSMINEASRCLEEKIARSARDIDMAMILGTGFPPFRGGLLRYAETVGLAKVVERLEHFSQVCGERFLPHEDLVQMAKEHRAFPTT